MSVNKVILIGNLGKDPLFKTVGDVDITEFSLATSKSFKDDSGEKQKKTEWHNIVCFRKTAKFASEFLKKGREIYLEGEIQTRSWDDKTTGVKKYKTEIIANEIKFVGARPEADQSQLAPDTTQDEPIPF